MLFVDDEESILFTLPRVLATFGFEITAVGSVDDALATMKQEQFDVLLSDLNLAEPNDGFIVVEAMRKAQPRCLNFVLTGYPADESFQRAAGHEVAHYFTKPVDTDEMVETIKQKLQNAEGDGRKRKTVGRS
jgi:DNA-binding NtrC family response regulator